MMTHDTTDYTLAADSTIGAWLAHPVGKELIGGVAQSAGMTLESFELLRNLPLQRVLEAAGPQKEAVRSLVEAANSEAGASTLAAPAGWLENVNPGRFAKKTVIVTGAASGIGRAVAQRVAREGGQVVAVDLAADRLAELGSATPNGQITGVAADITNPDDIERVLAATGGRVDGLANVAGVMDDFSPIHEVSDSMLERVFNVNVFGMIRLTRAVVPLMLAERRGAIVNIASEAALRGSSAGLAYTASKSAVVGITRSSAYMYERHGIRVNAVAPGGTLTGMRPSNLNAYGQERINAHVADVPIALPEALAASITFLLSDDGVNVNGVVLPSDGGESVF